MAVITQSYMEALGKQIFAKDYILNGLFPCASPIVKSINLSRVDWKFNDKFEYRMLMANTNSGGTINTQTFDSNFNLLHPGQLEFGIFQATYGALMDGFNIDMMKQLETRESRASFNKEYALRLHSMRINVASMFKNFVINGRYGVVHRLMPPLPVAGKTWGGTGGVESLDHVDTSIAKYQIRVGRAGTNYANINSLGQYTGTPSWEAAESPKFNKANRTFTFSKALEIGDHIRIPVPRNVFVSNFKNGRLLSRSKDTPWGQSFVSEMYVVFDNQPGMIEIVYIGSKTTVTTWNAGDYFELAGNRYIQSGSKWSDWSIRKNAAYTGVSLDKHDRYDLARDEGSPAFWIWGDKEGKPKTENPVYSTNSGSMEGISDLIPWYTRYGSNDPTGGRLGLDIPFRGQPNRNKYSTEQAGLLICQQKDQSIMDAIMNGVETALSLCGGEDDIVIFINPITLSAIGRYEQMAGGNMGGLQVFKEGQIDSKMIYQRGISSISFRVGEKIIPNVVKDYNLPTDVILLAPMKDISYNCWDNAAFELNTYIQQEWGGKKPPPPKDLQVPKELATKLDISQRITYGTPIAGDLSLMNPGNGWLGTSQNDAYGLVHPSNSIPVAYHEMGALFTENPYAYTVVRLCNQLMYSDDSVMDAWQEATSA